MPVYVIAQSSVQDADKLNEYAVAAGPTIAAHGGKILGYADPAKVVEGENAHPRTVMLQFESQEAFQAWYDSPEYQKILPLRLESTQGTLITVNGIG